MVKKKIRKKLERFTISKKESSRSIKIATQEDFLQNIEKEPIGVGVERSIEMMIKFKRLPLKLAKFLKHNNLHTSWKRYIQFLLKKVEISQYKIGKERIVRRYFGYHYVFITDKNTAKVTINLKGYSTFDKNGEFVGGWGEHLEVFEC